LGYKNIVRAIQLDDLVKESKKPFIIKKNGTRHELYAGDCIEVLSKLASNSIDLIITDPPYNIGLDYGDTSVDNLPWGKYYEWSEKWLTQITRVLSKKGSLYLMSYPEINARYLVFLQEKCKLKYRRWITWHYPSNIGHSKKNYTRSQRSILFMTKTNEYTFNKENILQPFKNPTDIRIKKLIKSGKKGTGAYDFLTPESITNIINTSFDDVARINLLKNVSKDRFTRIKNKKDGHPCQLPIKLLQLFMLVSSNPRDTVLDPFGGTFTTNRAALDTKRNSIGIEINPQYIKFGLQRLNDG